jgi:tRNA-binding protein
MDEISWGDFERVELRVGTITAVDDFPEATQQIQRLTQKLRNALVPRL